MGKSRVDLSGALGAIGTICGIHVLDVLGATQKGFNSLGVSSATRRLGVVNAQIQWCKYHGLSEVKK